MQLLKNALPLNLLGLQCLRACINFELCIGDKLRNFICLYKLLSQSKDKFDTFCLQKKAEYSGTSLNRTSSKADTSLRRIKNFVSDEFLRNPL